MVDKKPVAQGCAQRGQHGIVYRRSIGTALYRGYDIS